MNALSQLNVVDFSAALAADLAAEIYPQDVTFVNHGLSIEQGMELLQQPWFAAMVEQARRDWASVDNVRDRIRIKAQITLEESLPTLYTLITDRNNPAAARVAAFKEIKEVAGMSAKEIEPAAGFIPVQIYLGKPGDEPITISPGSYTKGNSVIEIEDLEDEVDEAEEAIAIGTVEQLLRPKEVPIEEEGFVLGMLDEDHF
jgi:hypothetical protein